MQIEEASFPENLNIYCRRCSKPIAVSAETLRDNSEVKCSVCAFIFTPDIDFEALSELVRKGEDSMLDSDLIM